MSAGVEHSPLGQESNYPAAYDASLLFPIARRLGRDALGLDETALPFVGVDYWTAYEVSWLNEQGLPQVAIVEFAFPCTSPCLVESKSFKLYLNSLNQQALADAAALQTLLVRDLSAAAGATVGVRLFAVDDYAIEPAADCVCLDTQNVACTVYQPESGLLRVQSETVVSKKYVSHLLRSLCPVTGQPDWGSVYIEYTGAEICPESLLRYVVSYRLHQGFHEQCVEHIYRDIMQVCAPLHLSVYARYTRRGGLDINPLRSSSAEQMLSLGRTARQ